MARKKPGIGAIVATFIGGMLVAALLYLIGAFDFLSVKDPHQAQYSEEPPIGAPADAPPELPADASAGAELSSNSPA